MGNRTDPSHRPAGAGGAAATEGERPGGAVTAGSVRDAVRLARALIADAPRRVALALLLMLAAGMTEAFGILMIVPLLQVVGLGGPAGRLRRGAAGRPGDVRGAPRNAVLRRRAAADRTGAGAAAGTGPAGARRGDESS